MTFATYDVISHDHHHEHPIVAKFCRNEPRKDITARKKGFLTQKVNSKKILRKSLSLRRNVCYRHDCSYLFRLSKKSFVRSLLAVGRFAAKKGWLRSPRGRVVASLLVVQLFVRSPNHFVAAFASRIGVNLISGSVKTVAEDSTHALSVE